MYQNRSAAVRAENEALDSTARLNKAIDKVKWLQKAVKPFSQSAYHALAEILAILEEERDLAIARRIQAAKQI